MGISPAAAPVAATAPVRTKPLRSMLMAVLSGTVRWKASPRKALGPVNRIDALGATLSFLDGLIV
jgi:hypothetical protein